MASPALRVARDGDTIKLETGVPVVFALKFAAGKNVESRFPGGRVMFTAVDDRKLFLCDEDANELEHGMQDQGIGVADFMRVTKVKHGGRGGGFSIRVERVDDEPEPERVQVSDLRRVDERDVQRAQAPTRIEAQLEKSVVMAREHGPSAFTNGAAFSGSRQAPAAGRVSPEPRPVQTSSHGSQSGTQHSHGPTSAPAAPASAKGTYTGIYAGALMASIDAYLIAADYAVSKGIKINLELDFNAEDIRSTATSMCIQYFQDGGTRS